MRQLALAVSVGRFILTPGIRYNNYPIVPKLAPDPRRHVRVSTFIINAAPWLTNRLSPELAGRFSSCWRGISVLPFDA